MEREQQKIIDGTSPEDSVFGVLVKTSVKTLFYLFLILAVLAVFICQRFPFAAMKFYYSLESYPTALAYCKNEVKKGEKGANYYEALLYGIEMSDLAFDSAFNAVSNSKNDKKLKKAAESLSYYTSLFAASSDFEARCQMMDEYLQKTTSLIAAVGLYSFKDYVYTLNSSAAFAMDNHDNLRYDGNYQTAQSGFITTAELKSMFEDMCEGNYTPSDLTDLAIIFNQLSANLKHGGKILYDNDVATLSYEYLVRIIAGYDSEYSYFADCMAMTASLKQLYLLDAAATLTEGLIDFFDKAGDEYEKQRAEEYFYVAVDAGDIALHDYYDALLRAASR